MSPPCWLTVSNVGSETSIVNESSHYKIKNPSVFLVETGESPSLPETPIDWLTEQLKHSDKSRLLLII